jgi:hypothetical protein
LRQLLLRHAQTVQQADPALLVQGQSPLAADGVF